MQFSYFTYLKHISFFAEPTAILNTSLIASAEEGRQH